MEEAARRGLYNLKSTPEALPAFIADKNLRLFTAHGIFTKEEVESRYEILLENYSKTIHIESLTLLEMVRKDFLSSAMAYLKEAAQAVCARKTAAPGASTAYEEKLLTALSGLCEKLDAAADGLSSLTAQAEDMDDMLKKASFYQSAVLPKMEEVRGYADEAEAMIPDAYLCYPTYDKLLFSI